MKERLRHPVSNMRKVKDCLGSPDSSVPYSCPLGSFVSFLLFKEEKRILINED